MDIVVLYVCWYSYERKKDELYPFFKLKSIPGLHYTAGAALQLKKIIELSHRETHSDGTSHSSE